MEEFKVKAISSAPTLPTYGSGMWITSLSSSRQNTVTISSSTPTHWTHISSLPLRPHGRWFHTLPGHPGSLGPNNTLTTTVYIKPTHVDQYLHWDSNHFLIAEHSIYNALTYRAPIVCTSQHAFQQKEDHKIQALLKCNFPHGPSTIYITRFTTDYRQTTHKWQTTHNTTIILPQQTVGIYS